MPATNAADADKEIRRKPLVKAIAKIESITSEHPNALVHLHIKPPPYTEAEESIRIADLIQDTVDATFIQRQLMPKRLPASTTALLGHGLATDIEERDYAFFLRQLLNALRPRSLRVTLLPPRGYGRSETLGADRCLLPAAEMFLALIGNKLFSDWRRALDTLEIGSYIPVSQDSGSKYSFAFAVWRIKTLVINYGATPGACGKTTTSGPDTLPSILFDPSYGFIWMMSEAQGTGEEDSGSATKIVLVVADETEVKRFRKQIEGLAGICEQEQDDGDVWSDPTSRLELFRHKLYYTLDKNPRGRFRHVWRV